jgi:hypothetical protein
MVLGVTENKPWRSQNRREGFLEPRSQEILPQSYQCWVGLVSSQLSGDGAVSPLLLSSTTLLLPSLTMSAGEIWPTFTLGLLSLLELTEAFNHLNHLRRSSREIPVALASVENIRVKVLPLLPDLWGQVGHSKNAESAIETIPTASVKYVLLWSTGPPGMLMYHGGT